MSVIQQGQIDGCKWVRSHSIRPGKHQQQDPLGPRSPHLYRKGGCQSQAQWAQRMGRFATAAFFICFACGSTWNEGPMWTVMIAVGDVGSHPEAPGTGLDKLFSCVAPAATLQENEAKTVEVIKTEEKTPEEPVAAAPAAVPESEAATTEEPKETTPVEAEAEAEAEAPAAPEAETPVPAEVETKEVAEEPKAAEAEAEEPAATETEKTEKTEKTEAEEPKEVTAAEPVAAVAEETKEETTESAETPAAPPAEEEKAEEATTDVPVEKTEE
ncbi:hypothetical protein GBA52_022112 [Prunus armeniaca]|nr:hypothetical protein GBA52_022112 [Prunus armeniaca]